MTPSLRAEPEAQVVRRRRGGCPSSAKSSRGGSLNATTASVAVAGEALPVRISHGTPAHRHESISKRSGDERLDVGAGLRRPSSSA